MKIGIFINDLSNRNGTERAVTNLANILIEKYEVIILSGRLESEIKFYLHPDIKVVNLGLPEIKKIKILRLSYYIALAKKIKELKCYSYIIGTTHLLNIFLILFSNKKIKVIACEHMSNTVVRGTVNKIRKYCYKKVDKLIVLTKTDYKYYVKFIPKEKIRVIPNSLSFINNEKNELTNKNMVAVGRLTKQKGFDLLLESVNLIKEEIKDWTIEIYGEGEEKVELLKKIKKYKIEDIIQVKKPVKNIQQKYLNSSIYLLPSRWEGLPMVLIEALECGLPIISFDCPTGPSEIVKNKENGFLILPQDINNFAGKIVELVKNTNLRREMGIISKKIAKNYSKENIQQKWEEILIDDTTYL